VSCFKAVATNDCLTLSELLAGGALATSQALHYALLAAEALRGIHVAGQTHGSISVDAITIAGPGIQLLPASSADRPTDTRSDIFAFGGVLAELLADVTGANHIVGRCLASDPAARRQSIQQVIIELKLLILKDRLRQMRSATDRLESIAVCLAGIVNRLDERPQDDRHEPYWFPGRSGRGWRAAPAGETLAARNECRPALNPATHIYE
jgi:hypothetical protein